MKRISLSHPFAFTIVASGGILVANVLTGVLTARLLGANGRGQLASITTWAVMISWICTFGFGDALVYFQAKNQHDSGRVLGTALLVGGVLSIFGIVAAQALLPFGFRAQSAATLHLARLSMLWIPACVGMAFSVDLIAGHQRFFALNAARLVQPLSFAFGIVFLSAARQLGVPLVLAVFFSSYLVVFLGSLLFLLRESGLGRPSVDLTRRGMSYGLRLQGQALGTIGNARLDVMLLPAFVASNRIGLYVVAVSASSIVVALFGNLSQVVFPAVSRVGGAAGIALVERATRLVLIGAALLSLLLVTVGPLLINIMYGDDFHGSLILFDLLLPGSVLLAASAVMSAGLQAVGRPGAASGAQLIGLVVTVVGLAVTLPAIGVVGAAITSSVAYSVTFLAFLFFMAQVRGFSIRRIFSVRMSPGDIRWLLQRGNGGLVE